MTEQKRLNAKYGRFIVTRYDRNKMKSVQVGNEHPTIESALAYAAANDKRFWGGLLVDLPAEVRP